MDVEQTRRKIFYEYCPNDPMYSEGVQVFISSESVKKEDLIKLTSFFKKLYKTVKTVNHVTFRVCLKDRRK